MVCSAKLHLVTTTAQGEEALLLPGYVVCRFISSLYVIDINYAHFSALLRWMRMSVSH